MIQKRNIGLCIFLTIITCGIYGIIWFIMMTDDVRTFRKGDTVSGGLAFLYSLLTCGIYGLYWNYKMARELYEGEVEAGMPVSDNSVICILLAVFQLSIISWCIIQNELNKIAENN